MTLILKKLNLFDIGKPFVKIKKSELLFEQYRMALKQGKYDIEVRDDDAIKRTKFQSSEWIIYG